MSQNENEIDIGPMLNDINKVLKGHLTNLLGPIISEKNAIRSVLLNMPYVKKLKQEGFDPRSDEYYTEINKRIRKRFPEEFEEEKTSSANRVAPADSTASRSSNKGRRTVKLSPSQVAMAKRLNVPLEEYAKYVKE